MGKIIEGNYSKPEKSNSGGWWHSDFLGGTDSAGVLEGGLES